MNWKGPVGIIGIALLTGLAVWFAVYVGVGMNAMDHILIFAFIGSVIIVGIVIEVADWIISMVRPRRY